MNDLSWNSLKFAPLPYESAVSSLWFFSWRNVLNSTMLLDLVSKRRAYPPHGHRADSGWLDLDKAKAATGWTLYSEEERDFTRTFGKHALLWIHPCLRFCPLCLEDTFHSFWHQSAYLDTCPIHGIPLSERCHSCGARTDLFEFSAHLLGIPYTCRACSGPIAGAKPSVEGRRVLQQERTQIEQCFAGVSAWWRRSEGVRRRIERLLTRDGRGQSYYPSAQLLARSALVQCCGTVPGLKRYSLPMEWIIWRGVATAPMLTARLERIYPQRYHEYMSSAYRQTIRFLENEINKRFAFSCDEYKRHLRFPLRDDGIGVANYQPHLLALAIMRRKLEADLGTLSVRQQDARLLGVKRIKEFGRQTRRHWRAVLLCIYASAFARVRGCHGTTIDYNTLADIGCKELFIEVQTGGRWPHGEEARIQFEWGEALWPAVDGLPLSRTNYFTDAGGVQLP